MFLFLWLPLVRASCVVEPPVLAASAIQVSREKKFETWRSPLKGFTFRNHGSGGKMEL